MGVSDALLAFAILLASIVLVRIAIFKRQTSRVIPLNGPPRTSFLFGSKIDSANLAAVYDRWADEYGPIFKVPSFGGSRIVLCDPKAIAHFHARDTFTYVVAPFAKKIMVKYFGPNMIQADGKEHQRLRKAMTPAFSTAAIRRVTSVFYDAAHKVKDNWDELFESSNEVIIDVQRWANKFTLDSIGIAGFGHDFKALEGHSHRFVDALDALGGAVEPSFLLINLLSLVIPQAVNIPVKRIRVFKNVQSVVKDLADELLDGFRKEMQGSDGVKDRSILGLLMKESEDLRNEEIVATINLFLLAGYETTAISLTWMLVELSRKPEVQQKLREELRQFGGSDPTLDQLMSELPLLDAIVHETLRLHPPLEEIYRIAAEDDVIPLSTSVKLTTGEIVNSVFIPKGTMITSPIVFINRSEKLWGPDAKEFVPERWLTENLYPSKDLHGHRHIYTFSDGPKICLGKGFALPELKAALSVLIRNFVFELPDGPHTKVVNHPSVLKRPKLAGEVHPVMPLRVKQVSESA